MFCKVCGHKIQEIDKFCSNCGEEIKKDTYYEEEQEDYYETTLLSENDRSQNDDYYETTLLSEEEEINSQEETEAEEFYETTLLSEEEGYNETTLLSIDSGNNRRGVANKSKYIPQNAPQASLLNIITQENITIRKTPFIVGSERETVDFYVSNPTVSRQHAYIVFLEDKYHIIDNNSTNNTTLDGLIIEPNKRIELYNGALVQLSDELFQFCILND